MSIKMTHPGWRARHKELTRGRRLHMRLVAMFERSRKNKRTPLWLLADLGRSLREADILCTTLKEHRDQIPRFLPNKG